MAYRAPRSRRKWLYVAGGVGLLVVAFAVLELTNVINVFHGPPPQPTGPVTKGEAGNSTDQAASVSSNGSNTASSANDKTGSGSPATSTLAPAGTFVSNHHPNLSGHPAPNSITSDCTTNPGATCQITFTMAGTTKSLPSKTTDAQGAAYWNWTVQSVGLTQGTWSIQAVATNNGSTKTTADPRDLVVAP